MRQLTFKTLCFSLVTNFICTHAFALEAFEIKGSLQITNINGAQDIEILSDYGQIRINQVQTKLQKCNQGTYLVADNYLPENSYKLLGIANCEKENPKIQNMKKASCPKIYSPVCGQPPIEQCSPNSFCFQGMPSPVTYVNICEMEKANATIIHREECR